MALSWKKRMAFGAVAVIATSAATYLGASLWAGGNYTPRGIAAAMVAYGVQSNFRFPNPGEAPIRIAPDADNFVDDGLALANDTVVLRNIRYEVTVVVVLAKSDAGYRMKACSGFPRTEMPTACK